MVEAITIQQQSVGIIGAGAAGLITGYTFLRDGFQNVQLLTRDKSPGGVWSRQRVYPNVFINNVRGEFRFSPLPTPPASVREGQTGNRLCGGDMTTYMEKFADTFMKGKIKFEIEVLDIRRGEDGSSWQVEVLDLTTGNKEVLSYTRIVLCTGGCSQPHVPQTLSPKAAERAGFRGPVTHSSFFASYRDQILGEAQTNPDYTVIVVGGGKSGQDIASHLARQGIRVIIIFEKVAALLAYPIQFPEFIRKSRCLGLLTPHIELRSCLERFLHTTTIGCMITWAFWNLLAWSSFAVLGIPKSSPLRNTRSLFWGVRINDEGTGGKDCFHAHVIEGKISLIAPNRAQGYALDGESIVLRDGRTLKANAVILATGFRSSWSGIFTENTVEDLGIGRRPRSQHADEWNHYKTLASPPAPHPQKGQWASSIYRGIVPAKNITKRDFAINGAIVTANNGYTYEVISHWISSYFLGDKMRFPSTVEEALAEAERKAAWMKKRFPEIPSWANESYSSDIAFWSWPQTTDELLEDMGLPSMRTGGNWLTWPFKIISVEEIVTLAEERRGKREVDGTRL